MPAPTPAPTGPMRHFNVPPLMIFVVLVTAICLLAAFGDRIGMSAGALHWCQAVAGVVGMAFMAALPSILRDTDGDGIPDIFQKPKPPTGAAALLVLIALGPWLAGCGASALQTAAVGTTIALRATHALDQVYETDLERRLSACPGATSSDAQGVVDVHNACGDAIRAADRDVVTVLDALPVAIEAFGAGIAVQAELDAGAPIPDVVLGAIRTVLGLFDQVEALLRARGIDVPPAVMMVINALSALLPPAPPPTTVSLERPRSTLPQLAELGPSDGSALDVCRPPDWIMFSGFASRWALT